MPALTKEETRSFHDLYEKSYKYLDTNFNKFNQRNKIQVAIAVCKMSVPQKFEHSGGITIQMPTIQKSGEASQPINLEFNIGTPRPPENPGHTGQAPTNN